MMVAEQLNVNLRSNTVCRRKDLGTKKDLNENDFGQEDLDAKDLDAKKSRAQESPA